MGTSTPWGMSDYSKKFGPGITFYGTPSHGGFRVSIGKLRKMPIILQGLHFPQPGWFEEDSAYCAVMIAFPEYFSEEDVTNAKATLKNWYPDEYEKFYGEIIPDGESFVRRPMRTT